MHVRVHKVSLILFHENKKVIFTKQKRTPYLSMGNVFQIQWSDKREKKPISISLWLWNVWYNLTFFFFLVVLISIQFGQKELFVSLFLSWAKVPELIQLDHSSSHLGNDFDRENHSFFTHIISLWSVQLRPSRFHLFIDILLKLKQFNYELAKHNYPTLEW